MMTATGPLARAFFTIAASRRAGAGIMFAVRHWPSGVERVDIIKGRDADTAARYSEPNCCAQVQQFEWKREGDWMDEASFFPAMWKRAG
jgi:hypothetical protein